MGMSSTSPSKSFDTAQKVITLSNRPPAEYFTEYFICSLVFIVSVFQDMRCESITEPQRARKSSSHTAQTNQCHLQAISVSLTSLHLILYLQQRPTWTHTQHKYNFKYIYIFCIYKYIQIYINKYFHVFIYRCIFTVLITSMLKCIT